MPEPRYIDLDEAREVLATMGVKLSKRQMKRAAEMDAEGRRKLPFFRDPIEGRLKIDRNSLIKVYIDRQVAAENNLSYDL